MALDHSARDRGTRAVEFGGAMRRLAQQHHTRIGEAIEIGAELVGAIGVRQVFRIAAERLHEPFWNLSRNLPPERNLFVHGATVPNASPQSGG
ncbi:hypothetical protein [Sphingomonas sp. NFR15]|uniref:hypothetical protein n=1 Tax=Sphingomonas sp. NFR15 TaxID=1566282 RepID=UPI00210B4249|nr:hypothetical protein [Sphingomonas sp. NFR15]